MHGNIKRDYKYLESLKDHIYLNYGIDALSITPAKRGYVGETWKLDVDNKSYFVKLVYSKQFIENYKRSFNVINYLNDNDINYISRIVKTRKGKLYSVFDGAVLGVFYWIDGENIENDITKVEEIKLLSHIYTVECKSLNLPHECFTDGYSLTFEKQMAKLEYEYKKECIYDTIIDNIDKINYRKSHLKFFSQKCKSDKTNFYITHGDAGGNIIKNGNLFYIIDWDDPKIAPPERDAWFCMNKIWTIDAWNQAFINNGINYKLRNERLAYYAYSMYFLYLTEQIETFFEIGNSGGDMSNRLKDYFNCWIESPLKIADEIQ